MENNELIDDQTRLLKNDLPATEELIDGLTCHVDLGDAVVRLVNLHRVPPVVLDRDTELGAFDAQRSVFRDEHSRRTVVNKIETRCQDAVVDSRRIEDLRETVRRDPVQFDPE